MAFTDQDLATGNQLKAQLDAINDAQAKIAVAGAAVKIVVVDGEGKTVAGANALITALGANGYNTECADALTALNAALTTAETAAQAAFAALDAA